MELFTAETGEVGGKLEAVFLADIIQRLSACRQAEMDVPGLLVQQPLVGRLVEFRLELPVEGLTFHT